LGAETYGDGVLAWLVVEVDAVGGQEQEDRRGYPVHDEIERWPPACVGDIVVVLPEVLEPVAGEPSTTKSPAMEASTATNLSRPSATAKPM